MVLLVFMCFFFCCGVVVVFGIFLGLVGCQFWFDDCYVDSLLLIFGV